MTAVLMDLIQPIAPISPQTLGQDVYDRFQAEPETLAIAVVDDEGRPVGLVERNAFFVAVMSHEIRTPLNGVLAIADILQRKLADPAVKPYVATIQDSGQTLLRLLTDALDLSRADAGLLELAEDSFCVPALLEDLSALWVARAELKGLSLNFSYLGAADQWALGDVVRIKQVFNNLIGNALKFTRAGGVEVSLSARRDDVHVMLEGRVRDTGVGIPADRLDGIFPPFN